jgi:hypothetical protein
MKISPPADVELRMFVEQAVKVYPHEASAMASELLLAREALARIKRIAWPADEPDDLAAELVQVRFVLNMYGFGKDEVIGKASRKELTK